MLAGNPLAVNPAGTLMTDMALAEVQKLPVPKTPAEHKRAVNAIATLVSERLGNKPAQALKSCIDPMVFRSWSGTEPTRKKIKDWIMGFFGDADMQHQSPEERMREFYETTHFDDADAEWQGPGEPGDDDGEDDDEEATEADDFDAVYAELFGEDDEGDDAKK